MDAMSELEMSLIRSLSTADNAIGKVPSRRARCERVRTEIVVRKLHNVLFAATGLTYKVAFKACYGCRLTEVPHFSPLARLLAPIAEDYVEGNDEDEEDFA